MAKAFRNFFRKKDGENSRHNNNNVIRTDTGRDEAAKRYGVKKYSRMQRRRTSDSISNDPVYLKKLYGISNEGTIRLFKESSEAEQYCPDKEPKYIQQQQKMVHNNSTNRQNTNNLQVYTASVARNSTHFNAPSPSRPSESFPYKVYTSAPRRSTLHYGVDYEGKPLHSNEHPRNSILKSDDSYAVPSTSQNDGFNHPDIQNIKDDDTERLEQQGRHVSIVTPNEMGDIPLVNSYGNDLENGSVRRTVLRFRPQSSASRSSRESVKLMVFRSDQTEHPPMFLSRRVHQIPLKRIKRTPVLMLNDGRLLKPLDTENPRNSFDKNKEESRVRLSMADIENISKVPRQSTEIINPVRHSRSSMNRRNSIRQSLVSIHGNEKRSSVLREEPRIAYHYNMENEPMVYSIPIVPSRNRSNSLLIRQSVTSYDSKNYQNLDNEGTRYYEDERKPLGEQVQYRRESYQPDCTIMKKDKPIVVYEVCNYENNNHSISKNKDTGKAYTKTQRNSTKKSVVTNQPLNPQVEIIYQEPQTQPIHKVKEKHSFKNKISIRKSTENYMNESCPIYQQQPIVYIAEVPSGKIPASEIGTKKCFLKKNRSRTSYHAADTGQSKDFCGLASTCEPQEKTKYVQKPSNSNYKMVSSSQKTDLENDIDYLCYPGEKLRKGPPNLPQSDSKLKWRIIIKNQDRNK